MEICVSEVLEVRNVCPLDFPFRILQIVNSYLDQSHIILITGRYQHTQL